MSAGGLASGTRIGAYVVRDLLGRGGMAEVYRVEATFGGTFALKLLHTALPGLVERMKLEGEVQKQLRHPNLIGVLDTVSHGGRPGLVLELVDGPSLEARLAEGALPLDEVDVVAAGLFAGVAFAHRAGVLHRDLKPANVLLARGRDGVVVPRVGDFGLVKRVDEAGPGGGTRTGTAMGTPCYMPPEQLRDAKSVDERADVFALGVILYELVTGHRPWASDDLIALYHRMVEGPEQEVDALRADVPVRMTRAIAAALAPDRDARCASVDELAAIWRGDVVPKPVPRPSALTFEPVPDLLGRIDPASDRSIEVGGRGLQLGGAVGGFLFVMLLGALAWRLAPSAPPPVVAPPAASPAPPTTPTLSRVPRPATPRPRPSAKAATPAATPTWPNDLPRPPSLDVGVVPADTDAPRDVVDTPAHDG